MDAVSSIKHVVNNVSMWQTQVTELNTYAAAKHEEYIAAYEKLLHQVKVKKQKSSSIASLNSKDDADQQVREASGQETQPAQEPDFVHLDPLEAGTRFIYAQVHRKRKPNPSVRSNASALRPQRANQRVIIYYDSHIQMELDALVKAFGAARNNLRKGKNAYNASKGFALPSLSRRYESLDNLIPNNISRSLPRMTKASSESNVISSTQTANAEAAFAKLDKEIEQVQTLCETAAHKALRDGHCKNELTEVINRLGVVLTMADSSLEMLQAELQNSEDDESQTMEDISSSDRTSAQSTLCEKPSMEALAITNKILPPLVETLEPKRPLLPTTISAPGAPMQMDAIEVDDDEDESSVDIDFNINTFRAAGRRVPI